MPRLPSRSRGGPRRWPTAWPWRPSRSPRGRLRRPSSAGSPSPGPRPGAGRGQSAGGPARAGEPRDARARSRPRGRPLIETVRRGAGSIGPAMILSDRTIREEIQAGRIVIDPFDPACVQPSSVDLHVDSQFRVFANSRYAYIDVKREMPELTELVQVADGEPFILHPGEFVLGSTVERVAIPN